MQNDRAQTSNDNGFISETGGLRFKSRDSQIGHTVANGSPPLQRFFEENCVAHRRNNVEICRRNTIRHNTASIM